MPLCNVMSEKDGEDSTRVRLVLSLSFASDFVVIGRCDNLLTSCALQVSHRL